MGTELDRQNELIAKLNSKTDRANNKIEKVNKVMGKIMNKWFLLIVIPLNIIQNQIDFNINNNNDISIRIFEQEQSSTVYHLISCQWNRSSHLKNFGLTHLSHQNQTAITSTSHSKETHRKTLHWYCRLLQEVVSVRRMEGLL